MRIYVVDYVRCINASSYPLTNGNIYSIISIKDMVGNDSGKEYVSSDKDYMLFEVLNDSNIKGNYYQSRFVYDVVLNRRKKLERLKNTYL